MQCCLEPRRRPALEQGGVARFGHDKSPGWIGDSNRLRLGCLANCNYCRKRTVNNAMIPNPEISPASIKANE
jgi:hypothetical protein